MNHCTLADGLRASGVALAFALAAAACSGGTEDVNGQSQPPPPALHTISGKVVGEAVGVPAVPVTLVGTVGGDPFTRTTTTGANGEYAFDAVDGTYSLTPSMAHFVMSPANAVVTVNGTDVTQDFRMAVDPEPFTSGCTIAFGPPMSATRGCWVQSASPFPPNLFAPWHFSLSTFPQAELSGRLWIDGWSPAYGTAYPLDDPTLVWAELRVVDGSMGREWCVSNYGSCKPSVAPFSLTIGSEVAIMPAYGSHVDRPTGELHATVPSLDPGVPDLTVDATF